MSTLTVSNISNGSVSTSSTNVIQGSAKAWCLYNVSSQSILSSYNVSSVTYNSSGVYTFNFTNALTDANYVVCPQLTSFQSNDINRYFMIQGTNGASTLKTSSQVRMTSGYANVPSDNIAQVGLSVFR